MVAAPTSFFSSPNRKATSVDGNRDSIAGYKFNTPDFNLIQFRSNLEARWEYVPGSEIFRVILFPGSADLRKTAEYRSHRSADCRADDTTDE